MPTIDQMLQVLPQLTEQQKRAARLRATQEQFQSLAQTPTRSGVTRTQHGGLYETVGSYIPDYAGYAKQAVGALGGYYSGKKADDAERDSTNARNAEIIKTVEAIGQSRSQPAGAPGNAGATEQALRGYLSVLGGPDIKDVLGKQAHVSGIKTDSNGNMIMVMSDGSQIDTGRKADYNTQILVDPVTGEVNTVGKSGAGRGVAAPVTYGAPQNTPAPAAAPGGVPMAPSVPGPQPVVDIEGMPKEVQEVVKNGVAFMQSLNLPQEQIDAWVDQQLQGASAAQAQAAAAGSAVGGPPAVGAAAPAGAPLRVSGAGALEAAKTNAQIAAQNAAAPQTAAAAGLIADAQTQARQTAEKRVELQATLPRMKSMAEGMSTAIQKLKNARGLDSIVGGSMMGAIPNEGKYATVARGVQSYLDPDGANAMAMYDNVVGKVYQQAFETLKGGGPITEKETERVANAYAALQRAQTKTQFVKSLDELDAAIKAGYNRMQQVGAQMGAPAPAAPSRPALPAGFEWGD